MKTTFLLFLFICIGFQARSQSQKTIYMDVAHKEVFWHDPAHVDGLDADFVKRIDYMTGEFKKTASAVNAQVQYFNNEIKADQLKKCNLLFIHIPKSKYTADEVKAISDYLSKGGSLFLVMDSDYWSTLEQANVNDFLKPIGIEFGGKNADTLAGCHTLANPVTPKGLKVTCHDARLVSGGTPFVFTNREGASPVGIYKELKGGGRAIVMGEGMISLYMTAWEGVNDYQCQEFMQDAFRWLVR